MKRPHRTRLRLEREVLRTLQAHELHQVDGAAAIPLTLFQCPPPPITGDSRFECCA
jgi:hypothetical protein